jgi:predicted nucleic-acid-binding protein
LQDPVLDTNILLRHITADDARLSPKATAFLRNAEASGQRLRVPNTVVLETVWALEKLYKHSREAIRGGVMTIVSMPNIALPERARVRAAFDLYVRFNSLSFADCYHAQTALDESSGEIVTFDRDFRRVPGINRIEPA